MSLIQDLRLAVRMLRKSPGASFAAATAMALAIGANTAMFSVADAFLWKPLAIPDPQGVAALLEQPSNDTQDRRRVAPANYLDWEKQATSFERIAAYDWDDMSLTGRGQPEKVQVIGVTADFFAAVGGHPAKGRTFTADEQQSGHGQVAILSDAIWSRRYASDPSILGQTIKLDGKAYTVTGVMPKLFMFPMTAEIWIPVAMTPEQAAIRNLRSLDVVARLKPGVSMESAQAEMSAISQRLATAYPQTNKGWSVRLLPIRQFLHGQLTLEYTRMLLVAVGFVLLIACANVANVHFAMAGGRAREFAVRLALGASRRRLIGQMLVESVLLAVVGAAAGLAFGSWGVSMLVSHMPAEVAKYIPGWYDIALDVRAFAFTAGIAVLAGIIAGLAPALRASRPDLNEALKEGSRGGSSGLKRNRTRTVLLVAEMSLSIVLLTGAGLMARGVWSLVDVNRQFEPESMLTMRVVLPETSYKTPEQIASFYDRLLPALQTIPGVRSAAASNGIPYGGVSRDDLEIENRPRRAGEFLETQVACISAEYFKLMHLPIVAGRGFDRDGANSPQVTIVSQNLADRYFPHGDAIGKRIRTGRGPRAGWATIVGITADVQYEWIWGVRPTAYRPYPQAPRLYSYIAVRASGDPLSLVNTIRQRVAAIDPQQAVSDVKTLSQVISNSVIGLSYVAVMMSVLGVIALVLACVGIFGVFSHLVTERTREFGIRIALGAGHRDVLRAVMRRAAIIVGTGLGIGLAGAAGLARLMSSLIFGIGATDLVTFSLAALGMTAVALFSTYIPARRASRVDPMIALRYE
jgi:putative ABC transport system permease protein